MATWVRRNTTAIVSAIDADQVVPGTAEALDNATAPGDFNPAGVTQVTIQVTSTQSGASDDTIAMAVGAEGVSLDQASGTIIVSGSYTSVTGAGGVNGTRTGTLTVTSGIPTGLTTAQWEGAVLDEGGVNLRLAGINKTKGFDGSILTTPVNSVIVTITYTPATPQPFITQDRFRIYDDDAGESSATSLSSRLNQAGVVAKDSPFRIRFNVRNTGTGSTTFDPKLQMRYWAEGTGGAVNPTAWTDVNGTSSRVNSVASAFLTDNGATTERLAGGGTFVAGKIDSGDGQFSSGITLGAGQDTEVVFVVELDSTDMASDQEEFQFRLVNRADGALYDVYTQYPRVNAELTWAHGFEGGTDGNELNTTVADPDTIDGFQRTVPATGVLTYSDVTPFNGLMGAAVVYSSGGTAAHKIRWYDLNQAGLCTFRMYVRYSTLPSSDHRIVQATEHTDGYTPFALHLDSANRWQLRDATGVIATAAAAISANTWYRVEIQVIPETALTAGDATVLLRYYDADADDTTLVQEIGVSGTATTGTEVEDIDLGVFSNVTQSWGIDALAISNLGWVGPVSSTPVVTGATALAATATATATATARYIAATALTGTATLQGTGQQTFFAATALAATATLQGTGLQRAVAATTLAATATLQATGSKVTSGAATLAATGTLTADGQRFISAATTLTATGTLAATGQQTAISSAAVTATAQLSATATADYLAAATLTATSQLQGNAASQVDGACTLAAATSLSATGRTIAIAVTALDAVTSLQATGVADLFAAAQLAATATISATAEGIGLVVGATTLTANATAQATATADYLAASQLTAAATVTATGQATYTAAAQLTAAATISATAQDLGIVLGTAQLQATSQLQATALRYALAGAAVTAAATISGTATATLQAAATLQATATIITSVGASTVSGAATLQAAATVQAAGVPTLLAAATLQATSSLTGTARAEIGATTNLGAVGQLQAAAQATILAAATVQAVGQVQAGTPLLVAIAQTQLAAASQLSATYGLQQYLQRLDAIAAARTGAPARKAPDVTAVSSGWKTAARSSGK